MRVVVTASRFNRDIKRQKRRGKDRIKLEAIVAMLCASGTAPQESRPHKLTGEWHGFWECHIESDWVLIYTINTTAVTLCRTGSHSDLFG